MMSELLRTVDRSRCRLLLAMLVAGLALAHADNVAVGGGTLSWSTTTTTGRCGIQGSSSYTTSFFNNFSFVLGSTTYPLSGTATNTNGGGLNCPPSNAQPPALVMSSQDNSFSITFFPVSASASYSYNALPGYVNPKYMILAVTYAPPGSASSVAYNNSQLVGSSTAVNDSFSNKASVSVSDTRTFGIPNILGFSGGGTVTGTESRSYTQEADSSSSIALSQTNTFTTTVHGPDDILGVNHDYDVIWLWLNPLMTFNLIPAASAGAQDNITWTGYGFDMNDVSTMEIIGVNMGYLNGHFSMPSDIAQLLARSWAAGQVWPANEGPGLTQSDFDKIVAANPFSDPHYTVSLTPGSATSTDHRFTITSNPTIQYPPTPPGGNPISEAFTAAYAVTETQGQGAKYTHEQVFSQDTKFTGTILWQKLQADLLTSDTLTVTHQFSQTRTNTQGQTASFSVTGPKAGVNYVGPSEFVVYQDNVYGTFMFYPKANTGVQGDAARFFSQIVPSTMIAGLTYNVSVNMTNTGGTTWTPSANYRLGSQNPQDNLTWGVGRAFLTAPVSPGEVAAFNFTVTAPSTPGTYNFQWRMLQELVQWFGDFSSNATVVVQ